MGKKIPVFGKITCREDCDKLLVVILDMDNTPYFKGVANLNRPKELEELKQNLRFKGIDV